jgi:hypothetical protein
MLTTEWGIRYESWAVTATSGTSEQEFTGRIYEPKMYQITWEMQYVNLFMNNTEFIILAQNMLYGLSGTLDHAALILVGVSLTLPACHVCRYADKG